MRNLLTILLALAVLIYQVPFSAASPALMAAAHAGAMGGMTLADGVDKNSSMHAHDASSQTCHGKTDGGGPEKPGNGAAKDNCCFSACSVAADITVNASRTWARAEFQPLSFYGLILADRNGISQEITLPPPKA